MTQTAIANRALAHLGSHRIVDVNEASPPAEHIRRCWDSERRATLRVGHWNFARHRLTLSPLAAPAFGWTNAFALPADFLATVSFNGIESGTSRTNFELEGSAILCNSTSAQLVYIRDVLDCTKWDDVFVQAFALRLAAAIAPSLTASAGTADGLLQKAEIVLGSARLVNATDGRPEVLRDELPNDYLEARAGRGRP